MNSLTVYDGKSDDKILEADLNLNQTTHSSSGHVNNDLTDDGNNENRPLTNAIDPNNDHDDDLISSTHSMINSTSTASMPIPYQRLETTNQQPHMLLYQQPQR